MSSFVVAGHRWMFRESSALAAQPDTCLFIEEGSVDLQIPVSRLSQIDIGIKEALVSHLNHYCESLRGILISYSKLRLLSPNIDLSEVPSNQQDITVHGIFVIFRPETGKTLKGTITRVNPHHIGCLVLKTFTASLRCNAGSNINFEGLYNQDEEITFVVDKLIKEGFSRITGILTDDLIMSHRNSQPSGTVFRNTDDVYPLMVQAETETMRKKPKKHAQSNNQAPEDEISLWKTEKFGGKATSPDSGISPGGTETFFPSSSIEDLVSSDMIPEISSSKKKKHKREKTKEEKEGKMEEIFLPEEILSENFSSKKKKKKRKHEEINEINEIEESGSVAVEGEGEEVASSPPKKKKKRSHKNADFFEENEKKEKISSEIPETEITETEITEDASNSVSKKKKSKKKNREISSEILADEANFEVAFSPVIDDFSPSLSHFSSSKKFSSKKK